MAHRPRAHNTARRATKPRRKWGTTLLPNLCKGQHRPLGALPERHNRAAAHHKSGPGPCNAFGSIPSAARRSPDTMRPARRYNRICKFAIKNTSEPTTCENPTRSQCASASAEARLRAQLVEGDFPARDARPQHGSPSPCDVPSLLYKPWKKGPMDIGAPKASRLFDDKSAGGPCHRRGRLGERSALQHPSAKHPTIV